MSEQRNVSARAEVLDALTYLGAGLRWAATSHPGFGEFADDLRVLVARLKRATGRDQPTVKAEAECFDCGADALVRTVTDRGYADEWTCQRCGSRYDWRRYLRACAQRVEEGRQTLRMEGWGTLVQVSAATGTPFRTVQSWARRAVAGGGVPVACLVRTQALVVFYPDAEQRADAARDRAERAQARRSEAGAA